MPNQLIKPVSNSKKRKRRAKGEGGVRQRADGYWEATLELGHDANGKRIRKRFVGKNQAEVVAQLNKARYQKDTDTLPRVTNTLTVEVWMKRYLVDYTDVKESTRESYDAIVRLHINPVIGRIPLAKVTPSDIQSLLRTKLESGLSARRVQYIRAVLRMAFRQAVRSELLARNPVDATKAPKVERRSPTIFNADQARQFLRVIDGDRMAPLFVLALMTGLRRGELAGLKWSDVDFEGKTLTVRTTRVPVKGKVLLSTPKTAKSRRTITLPDKAVESLWAMLDLQHQEKAHFGRQYNDDGWVFCRPDGKPLRPEWITHHFNSVLAKAGLPEIRLHDLRHTHATLLLLAGVQLKVVSDRLGHTTIVLTGDTYQHVLAELARDAADKLDHIFH